MFSRIHSLILIFHGKCFTYLVISSKHHNSEFLNKRNEKHYFHVSDVRRWNFITGEESIPLSLWCSSQVSKFFFFFTGFSWKCQFWQCGPTWPAACHCCPLCPHRAPGLERRRPHRAACRSLRLLLLWVPNAKVTLVSWVNIVVIANFILKLLTLFKNELSHTYVCT